MTNPPNIDAIIAELSEEGRDFIRAGAWRGSSFYAPEVHALNAAELLHIDVMKSDTGTIRRWKAHLTPLGLAVRSALIGEVGRDG
jgi:hypothetical protein